ncbi:MAG TPA: hypothetical protein DCG08_08380 [Dialister sp.]|nr:hypothetical protein [Dialister sp.]
MLLCAACSSLNL